MQRVLIFGSTGPTGVFLVRETLVAFEGSAIILYVRTPEKLPEDLKTNPSCIVIQGELNDMDSISKAMEGVDIVLSALGPSQFSQPAGSWFPHGTGCRSDLTFCFLDKQVNRLIALGTVSIEDKSDKFNLVYYSMVKSAAISMRNAYKDIRAIGAVIQASELDHWTIVRVPILSNDATKEDSPPS
ncbi:hypothetical protein B0H11DRAFT_918427 [Mycena galericulata]|nr:hypothetical protein B0H11DRAFT_918427 [Mycena galericulata]